MLRSLPRASTHSAREQNSGECAVILPLCLQSRDFNLRVGRAQFFFIHEANVSKTDQVTYLSF